MRFQNSSTPTPWLNRRDQYRLLGLMAALLLVVFAVDVARRPENWNWFVLLTTPQHEQAVPPLQEIDFRVLAPAVPPDGSVEPPAEDFAPPAEAEVADIRQFPRERLQGVRDQQLGQLRREEPIFRAALAQAAAFSQADLLAAGDSEVGFRVLNVEPDRFRGSLITLQGTLWRLAPTTLAGTPSAGETIWEAWLFTADSGNNPWVVLLSELPPGLAAGEQLDRQVRVAGYFLKRHGYATETGLHVAPLLAGRSLEGIAAAAPAVADENLTKYAALLLSVLGLAVTALAVSYFVSDRRFRRSRLSGMTQARTDPPPESTATAEDFRFEDRPRGS